MAATLFNRLLNEKPEERDNIQKRLLKRIQKISKRKTISYFSNFRTHPHNMINFDDKRHIKMLIDSINADNIDFVLHSPGGFAEETEMIVKMLRNKFRDIRFIIPHSAKSAATMLALSGNEILMLNCAELGPIDPQVSGTITAPAQAIIDGFDEIRKVVDDEGKLNGAYIPLLNKMDVATKKRCQNAIDYSKELVKSWLKEYMFSQKEDMADAEEKARKIASYFSNHNNFLTHGKPITLDMIKKIDEIKCLKVKALEEENKKLADDIWEYHCRFEGIMNPVSPVNKVFHSEKEYIVNFAPTVEIHNPVQIPQQPPQDSPDDRKVKK